MTKKEHAKTKKICSFADCGRPYNAKGYCVGHSEMLRKGLELVAINRIGRRGTTILCSFDGCGRAHRAKGLCITHYNQQLMNKELTVPITRGKRDCKIEGCINKYKARGYCMEHYSEFIIAKVKSNRLPRNSNKICEVDDCEGKAISRHLCGKHYIRFMKYGDVNVNYANNYKRTKKSINKTDLKFTCTYEEGQIMEEFLNEMMSDFTHYEE